MDVLVVRHGIALDREKARGRGIADPDRALTRKGRDRFEQSARGLAKFVPELSALLTSPLRRARETAALLCDAYESVHVSETGTLLPEASPETLAHLLADSAFDSPVAVVGHEPHLSSFASWCMTGSAQSVLELKKGAALLLRFQDAPGSGTGQLVWSFPPSLLRRLR